MTSRKQQSRLAHTTGQPEYGGDPSRSMQVTRVAPDWPVPSLMHKARCGRSYHVCRACCSQGRIFAAVAEGGLRGEVRDYDRIANTAAALDRLVRRPGDKGVAPRFCYEAGRAVTASNPGCRHEGMTALLWPP